MTEQDANYGKIIATGALGAVIGFAGATVTDSGNQTQDIDNLRDQLTELADDKNQLQNTLNDVQTTAQERQDEVNRLSDRVAQLQEDKEQLSDDLVEAQDREHMFDYLPVFEDSNVEFYGLTGVTVDGEATDGEYDRVTADFRDEDENHRYLVEVTQYEETTDADDHVEDFNDQQNPVTFETGDGTHTLTANVGQSTGGETLNNVRATFEDDAPEQVDVEDVDQVMVDGVDVTDDVTGVTIDQDGERITVELGGQYTLNEGETVTVTYSDAQATTGLESVEINYGAAGSDYDYDNTDDVFLHRDGDTVVEVEGREAANGNEEDFEAQYQQLQSFY